MKKLFSILVILLLLSCEYYSQRFIDNKTKYLVWIQLYKIPSLNNHIISLPDSIEPFSRYTVMTKGKNNDLPIFASLRPDEIDSVVLSFVFQDTTYKKTFLQQDTSELFRCLINTSQETCTINQYHLKGARLVE